MSVIIVFILVVVSFSLWWLSQQRLLSKPWLEHGPGPALRETGSTSVPTAKLGIAVLLAVIGCLFALLVSAYVMRMEYADWTAPPMPRVLWLNTAILGASSATLQIAIYAARRGRRDVVREALVATFLIGTLFLAGQSLAWADLVAGGYSLQANPANGFFYLLTGLHGVHIAAGFVIIAYAFGTARPEAGDDRVRTATELCALYWHFLFLVWLGLFVLLAGWAGAALTWCRQIFT